MLILIFPTISDSVFDSIAISLIRYKYTYKYRYKYVYICLYLNLSMSIAVNTSLQITYYKRIYIYACISYMYMSVHSYTLEKPINNYSMINRKYIKVHT
jgi:hypothetical protein